MAVGGVENPDFSEGPNRGMRLSRRIIVLSLASIIIFLTMASLGGQIAKHFFNHPTLGGLVDTFYVDKENNVPTWFSSIQILFAAALTALVAVHAYSRGDAFRRHWAVLAVILVFLSLDEVASLHERTMGPLQRLLGHVPHGAFAPTWLILGIAFVAVVGFSFLRFFLALRRAEQVHLSAAAVIFLSGAIGGEMAAGILFLPEGLDSFLNFEETFGYVILTQTEELLEMTGILVFVDFLLRRLAREPPLSISLKRDDIPR